MRSARKMFAEFELGLKVLTPLHIGCGRALVAGLDYVFLDGRVHVVDGEALCRFLADRSQEMQALARGDSLQNLLERGSLRREDLQAGRGLVLRALALQEGQKPPDSILEHIKDALGRPYIPGSSLKGALRTALLRHCLRERRKTVALPDLDRERKSWAALPLERSFFGKDPNHDALRALHVGDSEAIDPGRLFVGSLGVFSPGGDSKVRLAAELLVPGCSTRFSVRLDLQLLEETQAIQEGRWWRERVEGMPAVLREQAAQIIGRAKQACEASSGLQKVLDVYRNLERKLKSLEGTDRAIVQLGFGTGWEAKTVGAASFAPGQLEEVLRQFKMARGRGAAGRFPRSVKALVSGGVASLPLGWVELEWRRI